MRRTVKRGEYLKFGGTTDTRLYYIESGCLRAFLEMEDGEQTIRFGYTGEFFTALDSFISNQPSPMNLQALRKTEVLEASKDVFMDFIESKPPSSAAALGWPDPELSNRELYGQMLSGLFVGLLEREIDLLTTSPAERYQRVFNRSPHLFQEVPAKYIANYLRMTPETLSRLRKS